MNTLFTVAGRDQIEGDSRRLWSLWDMMERYGFLIGRAFIALSEAKLLCLPLPLNPGERQISDDEIARAVLNGAHLMRQACIISDMESVLPELDRLALLVNPPPPFQRANRAGVGQAIVHLLSRLQDDLQQQFFFHLAQQDVPYYGQKNLFGEAVTKRFGVAAATDIGCAGSCLALQQSTACVFHLMRAMESAVRHLGKRIGVTITPQTTWRQMTSQMDPKIRVMPEKTERAKRKKNDWEAARSNLHHTGSVWRNNTMHPAAFYTQSQALDVMNAVRVFMTGLAAL